MTVYTSKPASPEALASGRQKYNFNAIWICRDVRWKKVFSPPNFRPGQPLEAELSAEKKPASVRLYYRHVTQAERYQSVLMETRDNRYHAAIPGTYTDSPYPLEYYFEVKLGPSVATLYPGLGTQLIDQPYFVVRRA